jgi:ketosteroid isomerase-like protein
MNAPERLWRGIARRDWEAVRAQFHPSAVIERPVTGTRLDVEEFIAEHRVDAAKADGDVEVLRSVADGKTSVIEARAGRARCAGIYDLHDGRIAGATEYWVS